MNDTPVAMAEGEHTIVSWIRDSAAADGARIAVDNHGALFSYATLAAKLGRAGCDARSCSVTVSGNSVGHVVAFFVCALAGITFIPLSGPLTQAEIDELNRRSASDLVLIEDEHAAFAKEVLRRLDKVTPSTPLRCTGIEQGAPAARNTRPGRVALDDVTRRW